MQINHHEEAGGKERYVCRGVGILRGDKSGYGQLLLFFHESHDGWFLNYILELRIVLAVAIASPSREEQELVPVT